MTRTFHAAEAQVQPYNGDITPPGHTLAIGPDANDPQGTEYLLLYQGTQPDDAGFVGSISVPRRRNDSRDVYDRSGRWIGIADRSLKTALADLADRTTEK